MVTTSTKVPLLWNGCIIKTICWVSSISLVPTVMQMSCNVWEPSDRFHWGTMVRKSEVNGNGPKSSEKFGSRKSSEHKGRTFELLLYTRVVKRELICVNEEVNSDMWDCPLHSAHGQSRTHAWKKTWCKNILKRVGN